MGFPVGVPLSPPRPAWFLFHWNSSLSPRSPHHVKKKIKCRYCRFLVFLQRRWMTSSKRVQDRSKKKRIHQLEIATERHKVISKILYLLEMLKREPENVMPVRDLNRHRQQLNLPKPHRISDFLRRSPKLFELYKDQRGVLCCGMSEKAAELMEEEDQIINNHSVKAAEYVTRMLMMSTDKRLPLDKIAHFRRDLGLPFDFRKHWVSYYPDFFKVVQPLKPSDDSAYLELASWKPCWAITELEKMRRGENISDNASNHLPGLLSLEFPLKFPVTYKQVYRYGGKIDHFQKREYLSPYADASGLKAGCLEFDKRAVAVMHELLSFTIEKRLVTDHLTHFRRELNMPQKLMRLMLKHFGIFYVSERGKRFSVFLTEAYNDSELIEKHPLVVWKEKVLSLVGYRGKRRNVQNFEELSEIEDKILLSSDAEDHHIEFDFEHDESMQSSEIDNSLVSDGPELEINSIQRMYSE